MRSLCSLNRGHPCIHRYVQKSFLKIYLQLRFSNVVCVAAENRKKITKTPYFGGSRSFKVIDVDTNKKLVTSDGDDGDEGRINFSVALSPKTKRTRNNKLKQ